MPLTPLDIHNKEFSRGFRGYKEAEVDDFLDEVVREFEEALAQVAQLKERVAELDEKLSQYRALEETLREALIIAQRTAEEVKEAARKEAELTVREAELKGTQIIGESEQRVKRLNAEYDDLKRQIHVLRARLKGMVHAHLDLVDRQIEDLDREPVRTAQPAEAMDEDDDEATRIVRP